MLRNQGPSVKVSIFTLLMLNNIVWNIILKLELIENSIYQIWILTVRHLDEDSGLLFIVKYIQGLNTTYEYTMYIVYNI